MVEILMFYVFTLTIDKIINPLFIWTLIQMTIISHIFRHKTKCRLQTGKISPNSKVTHFFLTLI